MSWRKTIMNQKDLLLIKAHSALMSTKAVLDKILRDDDAVVLSARVIGDTGEDETMSTDTQQLEETPIQKLRRETFEQVSLKTVDLTNFKTPQQCEAFFNDGLTWLESPALRRRKIVEHFWDARRNLPELPCLPWDRRWVISLESDQRIRVEAILDIICLIEDLHERDKSTDLGWRIKGIKRMREQAQRCRETPIETIRRHAFEQVAELTGKPIKLIANVYEALDWNDCHVDQTEFEGMTLGERSIGPRARREQLIHENLTPEPEYPPSAAERQQRARDRRDRRPVSLSDQERAFMLQQREARECMTKAVYKMFLNMRAEIGSWHTEQSKKNARKTDLQRQIMRAQAEYERLTAA